MKETTEQDCPLCSTPAEYHLVDYDKCKYFRCPKCGLFQVSLRAEKVLLQAPQQWRDSYAKKASEAPEDHALVIRVPPPSQEPGVASAAVSGVFAPMSELPQGQ
jgi:hypothetical protein